MQRFSAAELQQYLSTHQPQLIDVREPWEFDICHIDGSELIPMREVPERTEEFQSDQGTVVICHHGIRSLQVILYLERFGVTDLINLEGGVDAWARQVDLSMNVY